MNARRAENPARVRPAGSVPSRSRSSSATRCDAVRWRTAAGRSPASSAAWPSSRWAFRVVGLRGGAVGGGRGGGHEGRGVRRRVERADQVGEERVQPGDVGAQLGDLAGVAGLHREFVLLPSGGPVGGHRGHRLSDAGGHLEGVVVEPVLRPPVEELCEVRVRAEPVGRRGVGRGLREQRLGLGVRAGPALAPVDGPVQRGEAGRAGVAHGDFGERRFGLSVAAGEPRGTGGVDRGNAGRVGVGRRRGRGHDLLQRQRLRLLAEPAEGAAAVHREPLLAEGFEPVEDVAEMGRGVAPRPAGGEERFHRVQQHDRVVGAEYPGELVGPAEHGRPPGRRLDAELDARGDADVEPVGARREVRERHAVGAGRERHLALDARRVAGETLQSPLPHRVRHLAVVPPRPPRVNPSPPRWPSEGLPAGRRAGQSSFVRVSQRSLVASAHTSRPRVDAGGGNASGRTGSTTGVPSADARMRYAAVTRRSAGGPR